MLLCVWADTEQMCVCSDSMEQLLGVHVLWFWTNTQAVPLEPFFAWCAFVLSFSLENDKDRPSAQAQCPGLPESPVNRKHMENMEFKWRGRKG